MLFISGSKNSSGKAATHSRFPRTQAERHVNQPFHYSTTGKSTKALCVWPQGVLPYTTVSRSGMEASWQLFVISSGDAGLLSKDQQLLYQSKGNWYNWKQHLERKGVAHCSTEYGYTILPTCVGTRDGTGMNVCLCTHITEHQGLCRDP